MYNLNLAQFEDLLDVSFLSQHHPLNPTGSEEVPLRFEKRPIIFQPKKRLEQLKAAE